MPTIKRATDAKGTYWEVRWRGPDGEHKRRRRTRAEADRQYAVATVDEARRRDPLAHLAVSDVSLGYVIEQWWEAESYAWAGHTRDDREGIINKHLPAELKAKPIRHIFTGEIQQLLRTKTKAGYSRGHVSKIKSVLNLAYKFAVVEGYLTTNPVAAASVPKPLNHSEAESGEIELDSKEVLTPEQVRRIAEEIDSQFRVLVLALGQLGMRISEAGALRVDHLDLNAGTLSTRNALDGATTRNRTGSGIKLTKNRRRRTLIVPDGLLMDLAGQADGKEPQDWLFPMKNGGKLNPNNFRRRYWNSAVRVLGYQHGPFDYATPHQLRHTAATVMLSNGISPAAIQKQLGWTNAEALFRVYAGVLPDDARDIRKALGSAWT